MVRMLAFQPNASTTWRVLNRELYALQYALLFLHFLTPFFLHHSTLHRRPKAKPQPNNTVGVGTWLLLPAAAAPSFDRSNQNKGGHFSHERPVLPPAPAP